MSFTWHLYLMAFIYTLAGINHFRNPRMYQKNHFSYFPNPKLLNNLSGTAEIILGITLMMPRLTYAAGNYRSLIAIFPSYLHVPRR
jgi:uncharacterized membrane protein